MVVHISNYKGIKIRFVSLPNNGLLLNTKDVCSVLKINNRPAGSVLSGPCIDLAGAINVAASDTDFGMWLNETFANYNPQTLVHPQCDDDWRSL